MRKFIMVIAVLFALSFGAKAQWYVGGSLGIGYNATSGYSLSGNIAPEFGYVFGGNMAVGSIFLFGGGLISGDPNCSTFNFAFTPYFRWAFANIGDLRFMLDGMVSVGSESVSQRYSGQTLTNSAFAWGVAVCPGLAFDFTPNWSIFSRIASIGVAGSPGNARFSVCALTGPSIGVYYSF